MSAMFLVGGPHDGCEIDSSLFDPDQPLPAGLVIPSGRSRLARYDLIESSDYASGDGRYRFVGWNAPSRPQRARAV